MLLGLISNTATPICMGYKMTMNYTRNNIRAKYPNKVSEKWFFTEEATETAPKYLQKNKCVLN